ncbi:spermatid-specific linker histone H1-like protein [Erinaceus europaeus]|uniref:Spermatid-specific linker histone H1-like protein n=1 Tax=Erinaceus europaeus TaxID=9365 RepID=A0A1S3WEV3_ERIEU|nr:spermatid-specific linker histone H1-like protein [Erinaceus europaeus]
MQKDTALPPPPAPLAQNPTAGTSAGPSKGGTRRSKVCRKPSISKVILRTVQDKGAGSHVSLATLKKALSTTGYDISRNAWRFKLVLKKLVEKGMLKQVTGKGASGSFRMGKKFASKFKLKARKQQRRRRQQPQQPKRQRQHQQSGQRQPGQRQNRRLGLLLGSKQGQKRIAKGAHRGARRRD